MRYRTIVADPPWAYDNFPMGTSNGGIATRELPYSSMTVADICSLPVAEWAERDSALFLWTTNSYLLEAFDVVRLWGYAYRQTLVWRKTNPPPFGGSLVANAEFLVVGRRGAHKWTGRWPQAVIDASSGEHSQKPEVFMDLIEAVSDGPYLEMFSRRARLGWDTWGDEALGGTEGTAAKPHA